MKGEKLHMMHIVPFGDSFFDTCLIDSSTAEQFLEPHDGVEIHEQGTLNATLAFGKMLKKC